SPTSGGLFELLKLTCDVDCLINMENTPFFDRMISNLRSTSKYYTGYPKDLGPSKVISFTSEREFVQLLHEGQPVA
ncbi:hypothetical protein MKW94_006757, partial [Papaver nudicaule]|nr:hypothetical protein [Papaver nudicaule]